MGKIFSINIHEFAKKFSEEYSFLYDHRDAVAGFREAMEFGDMMIREHPEFVREFNRYRGDILSSDREVAAFGFALDAMT